MLFVVLPMRTFFITCGFLLALFASVFVIEYLTSFLTNTAYKAVVWFLILILDANLTGKYLRWMTLNQQ
jgi:hypothetical protein